MYLFYVYKGGMVCRNDVVMADIAGRHDRCYCRVLIKVPDNRACTKNRIPNKENKVRDTTRKLPYKWRTLQSTPRPLTD